jgi:AraC family transcriptional regulator of adaptative response / DNA-3-methyladenine glycosylase II
VFQTEFGVSPVEFAQTHRLLLAKRLLTDTGLPITEIALASGFGSLRRFNALFRQRYRLSPSDLRKAVDGGQSADVLAFALGFRPPLDWDALLSFLGTRAIEGVERVVMGCTRGRCAWSRPGTHVWIAAMPAAQAALGSLCRPLAKAIPHPRAHEAAVRSVLQPAGIAAALGPLAAASGPIAWSRRRFELAVRAILGRQIG